MMEDKKCLNCGIIVKGRIDRKYCSDDCKNTYNNRLKFYQTQHMRKVNGILRKNRRIIADLTPDEKATVHKEMLSSRGFDFNYFTNIYNTKTGNTYFFCYEYGYLPLEKDFYALVLRREFKNS